MSEYIEVESCDEIMDVARYRIDMWRISKRTFADTSKAIQQIEDLLFRLETKKQNTRRLVVKLLRERDSFYMVAFAKATDINSGEYNSIFAKYAERALGSVEEYNYEPFKDGLQRGYNDPRLITITPKSKNLSSGFSVNVRINMDLVYGKLENWGKAVTAARKIQKVGIKEVIEASYTWRLKIYSVDREGRKIKVKTKKGERDITSKYAGKYHATMGLRFANLLGNAPWWKLLDKGNVNIKIPGNKRPGGGANSGVPYPSNPPTNFVSEARSGIAYIVSRNWKYFYTENENKINTAVKELEDDYRRIPKTRRQLEKIKDQLKANTKEKNPISIIVPIIEKRVSKYSRVWQFLSEGDIFQIAREIYNIISTGEEREYVRYSGKRMRIKSIINRYNREMERFR